MEALFKFILRRPPIERDDNFSSILLDDESEIIELLKETKDPQERIDVAMNFTESFGYINTPKKLAIFPQLKKLNTSLSMLENKKVISNNEIEASISNAFGMTVSDIILENILIEPISFLKNSLVTMIILPSDGKYPIEKLSTLLRDCELIIKVNNDKQLFQTGKELRKYRNRSLLLPKLEDGYTPPIKYNSEKVVPAINDKEVLINEKLAHYKELKQTVKELKNIDENSAAYLSETNTPTSSNKEVYNAIPDDNVNPSTLKYTEKIFFSHSKDIMKNLQIDFNNLPLDKTKKLLADKLSELHNELNTLLPQPKKCTFKRIGNNTVLIESPIEIMAYENYDNYNDFPTGFNPKSIRRGSMTAGIGDLLIVKQQLIGYERTDVAHIENILKGEKKEREHNSRRETVELFFRETETTTSEERELESTSRYEMSKESDVTIQEDASLKAGLTVSGSYGPSVDFTASAEGSYDRSKTEAIKTASTFSKDITERSANKITKRVLERSSLQVTNEVIEKNIHALNNTEGKAHISGVYQWVNKVYEAQIFNYGERALFDFMVPEPGTYFIQSLEKSHSSTIEKIIKPDESITKITPNDISEEETSDNFYLKLISLYHATNIVPPIKERITIFKSIETVDSTSSRERITGEINIPKGYKAINGSFETSSLKGDLEYESNPVSPTFSGYIGNFTVSGRHLHIFNFSNYITSKLPYALQLDNISTGIGMIKIECERTEAYMNKWCLDTYTKLMDAYRAQLADYEEKISDLEIQEGVDIEGQNPAINLELMKDEFKKHCLSILVRKKLDNFNATDSDGFINFANNDEESSFVRFFEQAFEWEHMTWVTYPYFWGDKDEWKERIFYEDVDPLFNQFLKAGYARVVVPARPGFFNAIRHYINTKEVWNGGPLPTISPEGEDDLYVSIAEELSERLKRPEGETPEGNPWIVKIPTTLVKLRDDDKLPKWKKDEETEKWVENSLKEEE